MMVIQVRVVVRVPETYKERFQPLIEALTCVIRAVLPELESVKYASPVTVTIDEFKEKIDSDNTE